MKRLHINLSVEDVAQSSAFYTALFGVAPTVSKPDYAKWLLDDPRMNFALSSRGGAPGVNHLGIQADSQAELTEVLANFQAAEGPVRDDGQVTCCYAHSEKSWTRDPQGIAWEAFRTTGASDTFGDDASEADDAGASACCATPDPVTQSTHCCA